tara:strand:+ start:2708 stop:2914 length:207 start_codon:yes stop_codon:yes gene_type:complete
MIHLRYCEPFSDDWSEAAFTGDSSAAASDILAASLLRLEWEVHISRRGGEWFRLGDEEPILDFEDDNA